MGSLGYDERSETWYVDPPDSHRLALTRSSLARFIQLYNSIHQGEPLVLLTLREMRRLEEAQHRGCGVYDGPETKGPASNWEPTGVVEGLVRGIRALLRRIGPSPVPKIASDWYDRNGSRGAAPRSLPRPRRSSD